MMAIISMFFQNGLTGSAWGDWALCTASPLRAFEQELGVQAPAGLWDPLGYTNAGNVDAFSAAARQRFSMAVCPCVRPWVTVSLSTSNGQASCPRP